MTAVTLHNLLWGIPRSRKVSKWPIATHAVPAIGLPTRVAAALLLAACRRSPPKDWGIDQGPLVWQLTNSKRCLAEGRRLQLGYSEPDPQGCRHSKTPTVERSKSWQVPPHPAYYMPLNQGSAVHPANYVLYCDVLLFLTALDGSEHILHSLYRSGLAGAPFEDRWDWRSRIHLTDETWKAVDKVVRWGTSPANETTLAEALVVSIDKSWRGFSYDGFLAERIDLSLQEGAFLELVRSTGQFQQSPALPYELRCPGAGGRANSLSKRLKVRLAQVSQWYANPANTFPHVSPTDTQAVMQQVAAAFDRRASTSKPDLLLLPEVVIPQNEVSTLRQLVAKTGIAALAGLYWRQLPPVYPVRHKAPTQRWIVNEAELVVPLGHGTPGPISLHWFRIRKPIPAHMDEGLARAISKKSKIPTHLLEGRRWYRFVHHQWGDFSIAICADLIDAEPWRIFRGELLHLFTVAFNRDVELYDSLTWVRAYESYVNVVAVNHGQYGGSFVWTPRRSHERELARLRGNRLFLMADVEIPVKSLLDAQSNGIGQAVDDARRMWLRKSRKQRPFKAPPPGYSRRH